MLELFLSSVGDGAPDRQSVAQQLVCRDLRSVLVGVGAERTSVKDPEFISAPLPESASEAVSVVAEAGASTISLLVPF